MADVTDVRNGSRRRSLGVGLFTAIALLVGFDVAEDAWSGVPWTHLTLELGIMALALAGAATLWRQLGSAREAVAVLGQDLERARQEAEQWREQTRELLRGLGEAIDEQFDRWSLSPAERQVGLMLLKGLSLREIAELRQTSERTVRQQAFAVYHKAGLGGRAELSAFFLEELLLPLEKPQQRLPSPEGE